MRTLERVKVGITVDKEKVQADPMVLFTRLLVLAERSEDRRVCFDYELTPTPKSLFENSIMRKPNKSALGRALRQEVPIVDVPSQSFYVLDGRALLHKIKWPEKSTFEEIIAAYVTYVGKKYGRSAIVFDGYDNGPNIKDHEHKRRTGKISADIDVFLNKKPACDQETFLKNSKNKSKLISLLADFLRREDHDARQSIGDADT